MINEISTEGIIIKSAQHGENSRLLHFLTPDYGVISIVKHGFSSRKNTGRSILQPLNHVNLEIIEEKNKYKINDFELLDNFINIRENYDKINTVLNIFAVLNKLPLNDLDGNRMIFFLVKKLLEATNTDNNFSSINTEIYFYFQLAWCLGLNFNFPDNCNNCGSSDNLVYLDIANGHILCKKCSSRFEYAMPLSDNLSSLLRNISKIKFNELYTIKPEKENIKKEFVKTFNLYTDFHINHKIIN